MKRLIAFAAALALCVSMTGCSALDYVKASDLYKKEDYAGALTLYESLGAFADSEKMAAICTQKADYAAAQKYFAAGQYEQALPLYQGLGMYADSPLQAVICQYQLGLSAFGEEDYAGAIGWLEPLGHYEDSADWTQLARWQWLRQSRHTLVLEQGESFCALSIEPVKKDELRLRLEQKSLLLGLPYEMDFTLTLTRNSDRANYTIYYESVSDTKILEMASGSVALGNFAAGGYVQTESFTQITTNALGETVTTDDVAQAIMVPSLLSAAQTQILTNLPRLLEKSGVDISPADLGL